jgi:hypothetical protein
MRKGLEQESCVGQRSLHLFEIRSDHNEIGIDRVDRLGIAIHRQTANQTPRPEAFEDFNRYRKIARPAIGHGFVNFLGCHSHVPDLAGEHRSCSGTVNLPAGQTPARYWNDATVICDPRQPRFNRRQLPPMGERSRLG